MVNIDALNKGKGQVVWSDGTVSPIGGWHNDDEEGDVSPEEATFITAQYPGDGKWAYARLDDYGGARH